MGNALCGRVRNNLKYARGYPRDCRNALTLHARASSGTVDQLAHRRKTAFRTPFNFGALRGAAVPSLLIHASGGHRPDQTALPIQPGHDVILKQIVHRQNGRGSWVDFT